MAYTFAQVKKTVIAAATLLVTGLGYVVADETLSGAFPPEWIAVAGALVTVFGVFQIRNDPLTPKQDPEAAPAVEDEPDPVATHPNEPPPGGSESMIDRALK